MSSNHADAKAQAKAAKAYAKATRPWFQKKRFWLLGLIAIIIIASIAGGAGKKDAAAPAPAAGQTAAAANTQAAAPADATPRVELKVTSKNKVNIVYGVTGGTSQTEAKGTWSKALDNVKTVDGVVLTVTNADFTSSNDITCEILINGVSKAKQSGSGTSAMAGCNASVIG